MKLLGLAFKLKQKLVDTANVLGVVRSLDDVGVALDLLDEVDLEGNVGYKESPEDARNYHDGQHVCDILSRYEKPDPGDHEDQGNGIQAHRYFPPCHELINDLPRHPVPDLLYALILAPGFLHHPVVHLKAVDVHAQKDQEQDHLFQEVG